MSINKMLNLFQFKKGYRYNSDSVFLYHFASKFCKGKILDIGCGCGILGLLIKRDFPKTQVDMLDFQEENIFLSKKNAKENNLEVNVISSDFLKYDGKNYDFLISNPPFYHEGNQKTDDEHLSKSRYNENLPIKEFAKKCFEILKPNGRVCFCYDTKQLPKIFQEFLHLKFNIEQICFIHAKKEKDSSLVLVMAKKNSKSLLKVLSPLIVQYNNQFTQEAKNAFEFANTKSLQCQ